jgi:hypothetical protein
MTIDLDVSFHEECISMLLTDHCALGLPILPLMKKGSAGSWKWLWLVCFPGNDHNMQVSYIYSIYIYAFN